MSITRRTILLGAAAGALATPFIRVRPAMAAEFSYKVANNQPLDHPSNIRLAEAPSFGKAVLFHDKYSRGALAYLALAGEINRRESAAETGGAAQAT